MRVGGGRDTNVGVVALCIALTALVVGSDVIEGSALRWPGLLAAIPLLAAAMATPLVTGAVAVLVTIAALGLYSVQTTPEGAHLFMQQTYLVPLAGIGGASVVATLLALRRQGRLRVLVALNEVAEAAQGAIMRPVPEMVDGLRCSALYRSAADGARIGGDVVEVLTTSFGTRILVGDVRGKGMDAVRTAGVVLGAFREVAHTEPTLSGLASALHCSVARDARPEEFVTACLLQVQPDGDVQLVSCGHPPPFLVRPGEATASELGCDPAPPLGMVSAPPRSTFHQLAVAERLVLVTDGLLEARRPTRWWMRGPLCRRATREFFPAAPEIALALGDGPATAGLEVLRTRVEAWTGGDVSDDMALLVLERAVPPRPRSPQSAPATVAH